MNNLHKIRKTATYLWKKFWSEMEILETTQEPQEYVFYRCTECGFWTKSLGFLHGHLESHTGFFSIADFDKYKEMTEKIVVEEYTVEEIDDLSEEHL